MYADNYIEISEGFDITMDEYRTTEILRYLGYNIPIAKNWIGMCSGLNGDSCGFELNKVVKEAETHQPINFNANIAILSDRLYGVAVGLHYFLQKCTNAKTSCAAFSGQDVLETINSEEIDFLIVVGYLRYENNYDIFEKLRESENPPQIIIWASPDVLIEEICRKYNIHFVFDRWKPVNEFVEHLKLIKHRPPLRAE